MTVRVRFAPSPTGNLHIGGLRTALFNWLYAKAQGGKFLLRIEDTDLERSTAAYQQAILDAFAWVNIAPDEPIVVQSHRIAQHQQLVTQLLAEGKAYKCYCTVADLDTRLAQPDHPDRKYDGYCRSRTDVPADKSYAIRFAVNYAQELFTFDDLIRGPVTFPRDQFDDFVIVRSDGTPMYNFVVAADDDFMQITHIIRGEEHLINTPKQIWLYQAFGWPVPRFAHLPLILAPSGAKLSKRDAATSVIDYRLQGYLPDALLNYLVRLGWSHGDQEIFAREELCRLFTLDTIGKKGSIFDIAKLKWLNNHYIQQLTSSQIVQEIVHQVDPAWLTTMNHMTMDQVDGLVALYKDRADTLLQLAQMVSGVSQEPVSYDMTAVAPYMTATTKEVLQDLIVSLQSVTTWDLPTITSSVKQLAVRHGLQLPQLAHPVRCALLGTITSPSVFALVTLLSQNIVVHRLQKFIEYLESTAHHAAIKGGSA